MLKWRVIAALLMLTAAAAAHAAERVDLEVIHRIKDEAFNRSKVMDHLFYLTDVNGPRLAGSPGFRRAAEWSVGALQGMGIESARLEGWGRGLRAWSHTSVSVRMLEPVPSSIPAAAVPWSAGTAAPISGEAVFAPLLPEDGDPTPYDLEKLAARIEEYRAAQDGRLRGKIVLIDPARAFDLPVRPAGSRYDATSLGDLALAPEPRPMEPLEWPLMKLPADREERDRLYDLLPPVVVNDFFGRQQKVYDRLNAFLSEQGAAAVLMVDRRGDGGIIFADSYGSWVPGAPIPPPMVVLGPESYNRVVRLVERRVPVVLEVHVESRLDDRPAEGVNVIAEIPGASGGSEIVMLGGHLDSWTAGTGATDNAAGCAVALEVMRILKALDLRTARTVRVALWDGEEQAYFGSLGYVRAHFGDPETMRLKPDHARLSVYFNLDNGGGRIRGVYLQGNDMARPIFEAWLAPFRDLGVTTITIRNTGLTDHQVFDSIGLPGFQFVQDPLDYSTRTHHSNLDVYDHVEAGDLMQAAAVMASLVYHAATREEMMPRKPLPRPIPKKSS